MDGPHHQHVQVPPFSAAAAAAAIVTAAATEAINNINFADPLPPPPPVAYNHPPYAEMIHKAIEALKEKNGSSKVAIAKYIERAYPELPPTHSALLTHHLKRLKSSGHLVMVKKSYKIPRSDEIPANSNLVSSTSSAAKRGRGRPPKPKPTSIPPPILTSNGLPDTQPIMHTRPVSDASSFFADVQPVLVSVGLADELPAAVKRRPGRPPKSGLVTQVTGAGSVLGKRGRGRPPGSGPKKALGRPKRPKTVSVLSTKRGRGRPPKTVVVPYANPLPSPTKIQGRPKTLSDPAKDAGAEMQAKRRPGRPPKAGGPVKMIPRKTTGRPVGRPKKASSAVTVRAEEPESQATFQNLRGKIEFLQLRVKQAVWVLKPHLTTESAVSAVAEMEALASMDINSIPLTGVEVQAQAAVPPPPTTF